MVPILINKDVFDPSYSDLKITICNCNYGCSNIISRWLSRKESACQCRRCGLDPWVGKVPWRRKWQPTPVFFSGESHGQRSLVGYRAGGSQITKELDMTYQLNNNNKSIRETPSGIPWPFPRVRTEWGDVSCEPGRGSHHDEAMLHVDIGLSSQQNCDKFLLSIGYPVCGILLS